LVVDLPDGTVVHNELRFDPDLENGNRNAMDLPPNLVRIGQRVSFRPHDFRVDGAQVDDLDLRDCHALREVHLDVGIRRLWMGYDQLGLLDLSGPCNWTKVWPREVGLELRAILAWRERQGCPCRVERPALKPFADEGD
jgi:hypothetical protein